MLTDRYRRVLAFSLGLLLLAATLGAAAPAVASTPLFTEFGALPYPSNAENITTGPDGNLWFTDINQGAVGRMTPQGTVTEFPVGNSPLGITTGPDGNLWVALNRGNAIARVTPAGQVSTYAVQPSSKSANCHGGHSPAFITTGPDGNLWFTEWCPSAIVRLSVRNPRSMKEFVLPLHPDVNPINGNSDPQVITVGPDGNLWFTEEHGNRIGRITPTGTITEFTLPLPAWGVWANLIPNNPFGITTGSDGNLWFTEEGCCRVGRITPAGAITTFFEGTNNLGPGSGYDNVVPTEPVLIVAGRDGNLWFSDPANSGHGEGYIGRVTTSGQLSIFPTPGGDPNADMSSFPLGLTLGPASDTTGIWFTDIGALGPAQSEIGRLDTTQADAHALTVTNTTVKPVEGIPFNGTVATFTDADGNADPSAYSATINWTDGTTSAGTISGSGPFTVTGSHTYADDNNGCGSVFVCPGGLQISISDTDGYAGRTSDGSGTYKPRFGEFLSIADALLTASGTTLPLSGASANGVVANFTDANPLATMSDFSATIDWGDGSTSAGTIGTGSGNSFTVSGSHTYAQAGSYTATVTIQDQGGSTATATTTVH